MKTMEQDNLLGVRVMEFPALDFPKTNFNMIGIEDEAQESSQDLIDGVELYY